MNTSLLLLLAALAPVCAQTQRFMQTTAQQSAETLVSAICLGCICEATTGCDLRFNCTKGLCGPLLISERYWADSGRWLLPGDDANFPGAYVRCATDARCAAHTVRNYVARFAQDCDGDGHIDCSDYARIHYFGGFQCSKFVERTNYWRTFSKCLCATALLNG